MTVSFSIIIPTADWLQALARHLGAAPGTVVGGPVANALPGNIYAAAGHALIEAVNSFFNADPSQASNLISGNLALSRADFWRAGGFDATLLRGEDRDFCDRCQEQGCRLAYAQDAVVAHARPLTLPAFWRRHFEYGQWNFEYRRRRALRGSAPVRFNGLFYVRMLRFPFVAPRTPRALTISILLATTQIAKAMGLLWQWARHVATRRRVGSPGLGPGWRNRREVR